MLMFFLAVGGNLCYALSIVLRIRALLQSRHCFAFPLQSIDFCADEIASPVPCQQAGGVLDHYFAVLTFMHSNDVL